MTLFEVVTILNLVILLYLVYNQARIDNIFDQMIEGFNELWEAHSKKRGTRK